MRRLKLDNAVMANILLLFGTALSAGGAAAMSARRQRRLLAASVLSQAGVIIVALGAGVAGSRWGFSAAAAHAAATLLAAVLAHISLRANGEEAPACFLAAGLSLSGMPPGVGFVTRIYVCRAAMDAAGIGFLAASFLVLLIAYSAHVSLKSARVVQSASARSPASVPFVLSQAVVLLAVVGLGVWPMGLLSVLRHLFR